MSENKKFTVRFRIPFKEWAKTILSDFKEFEIDVFIKENYYLHFGICFLICLFASYPILAGIFVTVFAGFREWYYSAYKKAPFSYADLRWTFYGGVFAYLIKIFI